MASESLLTGLKTASLPLVCNFYPLVQTNRGEKKKNRNVSRPFVRQLGSIALVSFPLERQDHFPATAELTSVRPMTTQLL